MAEQFAIINSNYEIEYYIDTYESMIWTTRSAECGDFELYTLASNKLLEVCKPGYMLMSEAFYDKKNKIAHLMIIEDIEVTSDFEQGDKLIVRGRSLKSILSRRIIWDQIDFQGPDETDNPPREHGEDLQNLIKTLINDAIVNPENEKRKIENFVFDEVDADFGELDEDIQYFGDSLYDAIYDLCEKYRLNYEVIFDFKDNCYHMHLINPVDHSYDQITTNPVIFSPTYSNLKNSNYKSITSDYKNVAMIVGEGDEYNRLVTDLYSDDYSGLERHEMHVDASDIAQEDEAGNVYGTTTYTKMLKQKGETELLEHVQTETFEGEAENGVGYEYGKDYQIGDIVEIINEYNISSKVFVKEMILSISTTGSTLVPTFESIEGSES